MDAELVDSMKTPTHAVDALIDQEGGIDNIVWSTMDGKKIRLSDMEDAHILNIISYHTDAIETTLDKLHPLLEDTRSPPPFIAINECENNIFHSQGAICLMQRLIAQRKSLGLTTDDKAAILRKPMGMPPLGQRS